MTLGKTFAKLEPNAVLPGTNMFNRFSLLAVCVALTVAPQAAACSVPPTAERIEESLRLLIDKGDYAFLGQVHHITKRRWGPDDTKSGYANRAEKLDYIDEPGAGYLRNIAEFSDATVYVEVQTSFKADHIDELQRVAGLETHPIMPIDLLRPFLVAGHGSCTNFPRTCPWDIEVGAFVAVVAIEPRFGDHKATYCIEIDRPKKAARDEILAKRTHLRVSELIWPFVEGEKRAR